MHDASVALDILEDMDGNEAKGPVQAQDAADARQSPAQDMSTALAPNL